MYSTYMQIYVWNIPVRRHLKQNDVMPLLEYLQIIFCPIFLRISCFVDEDFLLKIVFAPFYNIIFILCRYWVATGDISLFILHPDISNLWIYVVCAKLLFSMFDTKFNHQELWMIATVFGMPFVNIPQKYVDMCYL